MRLPCYDSAAARPSLTSYCVMGEGYPISLMSSARSTRLKVGLSSATNSCVSGVWAYTFVIAVRGNSWGIKSST